MNTKISNPSVMPIDRKKWSKELHLSNFINTYYQYRDIQALDGVKKVLIIGLGQGLDTCVLRWRDYQVTTFDIDETFDPDIIGSVHDLSIFKEDQFDAVIVSHVLEHLAVAYLDACLAELARVARYCLIYLPVAGRHVQFRLKMDLRAIDWSCIFDLFNYFHKPDGNTPRYCQRQHYWELGMRGFRVNDLVRRFEKNFDVLKQYRNHDWNPSHNFILKART